MISKNPQPKVRIPMYAIVHFLPTHCHSTEPFGIRCHDRELEPLMDKALTEMDLTEPLYIIRLNKNWTWDILYTRAGDVWIKYQGDSVNPRSSAAA